ncbi:MAG: hypothetical protein KDC38_15275, partial [Planctomycetes bacterium]|nr:hypothetical protein [Planctomycetota bacterium]
ARRESFLRSMFTDDWRNKAFAACLSLVIWFVAYDAQKTRETFEFDVVLEKRDRVVVEAKVEEGNTPGSPFAHRVRLTLTGQRGSLNSFSSEDHNGVVGRFPVDWIEMEEGEATEYGLLRLDRIEAFEGLPEGFAIQSCEPRVLRCRVDQLVSKEVPIQDLLARPADPRYRATVDKLTPETVEILAPSRAFETLQIVAEIDARSRTTGFTETYPLVAKGPQSEHVQFLDGNSVVARVSVAEALVKEGIELDLLYAVSHGFGVLRRSRARFRFEFQGSEVALAQAREAASDGRLRAIVRTTLRFDKREFEVYLRSPSDFYFDGLPAGVECSEVPGGLQCSILNMEFQVRKAEGN